MKPKMNEMWFSREDCKKCLHLEFIKHLWEISEKLSSGWLEILITGDGEATCVEFEKRYLDDDSPQGYFTYVDEWNDEVVLKKVQFPDGHYDYFDRRASREEIMKDWQKEHPNWYKNAYGEWINKDEEDVG